MRAPGDCRLIGRSHFVEADSCNPDDLAICSCAVITIGGNECGGSAPGILQAGLVPSHDPSKFIAGRGRDDFASSAGGAQALWVCDGSFETTRMDYSGDGATLGARNNERPTIF